MPTIKTILRNTKLSNNKFPIYLRVTHFRKSKFFKTVFDVNLKEWDSATGRFNKNNTNYIQNNRVLGKLEDRALKIINNFDLEEKEYTLNDFEKAMRISSNSLNNNMFSFWDEIIKEMILSNKIGNSEANKDTYRSLKKFNKNSLILDFKDVNNEFLNKYEVFLRSRGGTDGGIAFKMRAIRAVYNKAIQRSIVKESHYPFKIYKISKLKGKGIKKSLKSDEITKIINLDIEKYPHLIHTKNYFIFSYLTRGMNFIDMMKLNWSKISDDKIYYKRSKTGENFTIKILPPVQEILNFYKNHDSSTSYIFPILLKENLSSIQIKNRKKKTLSKFNKELKEIAKICKIPKRITSYVARHSFANCLYQNGAGSDIIKEAMGHKDVNTTKSYLRELDNSVVDDVCDRLLSF